MFNNTEKNYVILIEELSEAIQAISKIQRFGLDSVNRETGLSNQESLVKELGDVVALINIVTEDLNISASEIEKAVDEKVSKLLKFY